MGKETARAKAIARSHGMPWYKDYATCKMCRHWVNDICLLGKNPEKDINKAAYCRDRHLCSKGRTNNTKKKSNKIIVINKNTKWGRLHLGSTTTEMAR